MILFALLLVALPQAEALAGDPLPVSFTLPTGEGVTSIAVGALDYQGLARGPVFASGVAEASFANVPHVIVVSEGPDGRPQEERFDNVDVRVHSGDLLWAPQEGDGFSTRGRAEYGALVPTSGLGNEAGPESGTLLVSVSPASRFEFQHLLDEPTEVLPLAATVSLARAGTGEPFPGWEERSVNPGRTLRAAMEPSAGGTLLRLVGVFDAEITAPLTGVSVGPPTSLVNFTVSLGPAEPPRFQETAPLFQHLAKLAGDAGAPGPEDLLRLEPFQDYLNGALLLVPEGEGAAVDALVGGTPRTFTGFTLLRASDLRVTYSPGGEGRVEGEAVLAFTASAFVTGERASVLPGLPVLSLVLWLVAGACIAYALVRKPAEVEAAWTPLRFGALGAHAGVLLIVFFLWDRAFARVFGTSVLTLLARGDLNLMALGATASFELLPWFLAVTAFALPVRISVGVLLRYAAAGRPLKGFAKAAGFLALGLLGPGHALWFLNETLLRYLPGALNA